MMSINPILPGSRCYGKQGESLALQSFMSYDFGVNKSLPLSFVVMCKELIVEVL
jgi:hypothetical protein